MFKKACKLKMLLFKKSIPKQVYSINEYLKSINDLGYCKVSNSLELPSIDLNGFKGVAKGRAFIDIGDQIPSTKEKLFVTLMGIHGVQDLVNGYFDGSPRLWNVSLNYSDPSDQPTDSQLWHFDYGDVKQLHLLMYLSDVDDQSGPFSFLDKKKSTTVERNPWIVERWTDNQLESLGLNLSSSVIRLTGLRGDVYAADPGVILHQGARCQRPRLVMFVTFTTQCPLSKAPRHTITPTERKRLQDAYFSSLLNHKLGKEVFAQ
jgi:hypothetical protein